MKTKSIVKLTFAFVGIVAGAQTHAQLIGFESTGTDYTLPSGHYNVTAESGYVTGVFDLHGMAAGVSDDFSITVRAQSGGAIGLQLTYAYSPLGWVGGTVEVEAAGQAMGVQIQNGSSSTTQVSSNITVKATDAAAYGLEAKTSVNFSGKIDAKSFSSTSFTYGIRFSQDVLSLSNASIYTYAASGKSYAIYYSNNYIVNVNGVGTNYIGGTIHSSGNNDCSLNFKSGKYVFDLSNSNTTIGFETQANGRITFSSGAELVFESAVDLYCSSFNLNYFVVSFEDSTITFKADSVSDYTYMNLVDNSTMVFKEGVAINVILEDGFEAKAGESMDFFQGNDIGITMSAIPDIVIKDNYGNILASGVDYTESSTNYGLITFNVDIVVPEPSAYVVIFGALALGFAAYRRRK